MLQIVLVLILKLKLVENVLNVIGIVLLVVKQLEIVKLVL